MFGALPDRPTGLAVSVLRRAAAFATKGIASEILVDVFTPDHDYHSAALRRSGQVGDLVTIRNMYADLSGQDDYPLDVPYTSPLGLDGWEYVQDKAQKEVSRGSVGGVYKHFVWKRGGGKVHFIDHMRDNKRVRREWHDEAGLACKVEVMNPGNKPEVIRYLDRQGYCYLEELMDQPAGKIRGLVLNRRNENSLFFKNKVDLFLYWMQNFVLPKNSSSPTIISEYGIRRTALQTLANEAQARVIYTLHNNHFAAPSYAYGDIRPDMADFFRHLGEYTDVVVLTEEQRQDIYKQYGLLKSLHVVPHHMPASTGTGPRDPRKVVVLGRFHQIKGQMDVLHAFAEVVKDVPDARLEFYGRGDDEAKIRNGIEALGLSESVRIAGFTDDAYQVFSEAAVSVVASDYEGFCLSLAESMASGCVPISYDIKYGPKELIRNGVDGLLVEHRNTRELADAMKLLLTNDEHREQMSQASRHILDRLSEARFLDDWLRILALD
jgi:poly(glycerol-phosphate) alpha-glucosyltransferase